MDLPSAADAIGGAKLVALLLVVNALLTLPGTCSVLFVRRWVRRLVDAGSPWSALIALTAKLTCVAVATALFIVLLDTLVLSMFGYGSGSLWKTCANHVIQLAHASKSEGLALLLLTAGILAWPLCYAFIVVAWLVVGILPLWARNVVHRVIDQLLRDKEHAVLTNLGHFAVAVFGLVQLILCKVE